MNTPNNKSIRIKNYDFDCEISERVAEDIVKKKIKGDSVYEIVEKGEIRMLYLEKVKVMENNSSTNEDKRGCSKIIINLSNHPSSGWSDVQKKTAEEAFGEIRDMAFPNISPTINAEDLDVLVKEYLNKIVDMQPAAVHIAGEPVFVFRLVSALKAAQIMCVTSTTERMVHEEDGKKISVFRFVNFRAY